MSLSQPRVTALGLPDGASVRRGELGSVDLAALAGLWLVGIGGWLIVAIGLVSLVLGFSTRWGRARGPAGHVVNCW